ncbi:fumarylacetoacetate hydrolase family protein [Dickeya solani]|uniref:Fumarylacetoacetate hydrolase family protein n=1 Tax=Dickeya solani TaxID=1089444 RepID=A0ABU4EIL8_9GAMM|nr:fumarylacetoacetate hydrolase family protein [Dickeya solani]MCA7000186.1 fumarylacetoacetate hydrolase family protein [Dickeya solani]MCZ0820125.1 fumarylacetoacetate hydrolase family protein [Dickeya solani]MDV6994375.1 fumarylacetoacetate hydrolase family protein [Dickeya solani]MDV7005775.1 fumarylacetoacetate hydrolase family protein [Dickeya solani]MDV7038208.1 fumarylacetoacetate hydrolase family protein [Dickeya solani]
MKLASFIVGSKESYGLKVDAGIIDLGARLGMRYADLRALIKENGVHDAQRFLHEKADYQEEDVTFLPVINNPGKIFCVGMNYAEKRVEFGEANPAPTLFIRFPDSQVGHNCGLLKPAQSNEFDYEGELAVIIGKAGREIDVAQALEHVAGYSCYMDGSVRDWQHSWFTAGKNWCRTGAFGPWLVTRDEIPQPQNLRIQTRLNGQTVQNDNTSGMIHSIPALIAYISTFSALSPGDVIITGSPGGVGKKRNPPLFLYDGDIVEVEIEKIGCLHNVVEQKVILS